MSDLADAMRELDRCLWDRDRAGAERVLDEGYALELVTPAPAVMPRERWLEVLPDYVLHEYEAEEQHVAEDGDEAAVLTRVRMRATVLGEPRDGIFVITDVWRRRDDRWRLWRRHSTPLSAGEMPGTTT
ncbi:MAG: DUF4440 domain-containing protein [Acidimicrobiales bacterium]